MNIIITKNGIFTMVIQATKNHNTYLNIPFFVINKDLFKGSATQIFLTIHVNIT